MRVAFVIQRINHYRTFSTIISEGLRRNIDIECWHLCSENGKESEKGYLYPEPDKVSFYTGSSSRVTIRSFMTNDAMAEEIGRRDDVSHIISLSPPEFVDKSGKINGFRGIWCIVMHGPDSFKELERLRKEEINHSIRKIFFPYTQHFFDWGMRFSEQYLPIAKEYYTASGLRTLPAGCPMFDETIREIDRDAVRKKFGIPPGKKIVIYLPYSYLPSKENKSTRAWQTAFSTIHIHRKVSRRFNDDSFVKHSGLKIAGRYLSGLARVFPDPTARRYLFNDWGEPGIIKVLRKFCDRNDLLLVVKPRKKFDFSEEVYRQAHIIIDDDESQQYPSKLQELLNIAALGIGFFSTAVIEAIYQSVPFVNIECLDQRFMEAEHRQWHPNDPESLYNFDGVVWNYPAPDLIAQIPNLPVSAFDLDPVRQKEYMHKFLGPNDLDAKVNIFDALEQADNR